MRNAKNTTFFHQRSFAHAVAHLYKLYIMLVHFNKTQIIIKNLVEESFRVI